MQPGTGHSWSSMRQKSMIPTQLRQCSDSLPPWSTTTWLQLPSPGLSKFYPRMIIHLFVFFKAWYEGFQGPLPMGLSKHIFPTVNSDIHLLWTELWMRDRRQLPVSLTQPDICIFAMPFPGLPVLCIYLQTPLLANPRLLPVLPAVLHLGNCLLVTPSSCHKKFLWHEVWHHLSYITAIITHPTPTVIVRKKPCDITAEGV